MAVFPATSWSATIGAVAGQSSPRPSMFGAVPSRRAENCGPSTGRNDAVAVAIDGPAAGGVAAPAGVAGAEVTALDGLAAASGEPPPVPARDTANTTTATSTAAAAAAIPMIRPRPGPAGGAGETTGGGVTGGADADPVGVGGRVGGGSGVGMPVVSAPGG